MYYSLLSLNMICLFVCLFLPGLEPSMNFKYIENCLLQQEYRRFSVAFDVMTITRIATLSVHIFLCHNNRTGYKGESKVIGKMHPTELLLMALLSSSCACCTLIPSRLIPSTLSNWSPGSTPPDMNKKEKPLEQNSLQSVDITT